MAGPEPDQQSTSAKKAEFLRPFHGESLLQNGDLRTMHRERASRMLADADFLRSRQASLGPFLEIGAGSVQRSAALLNNHKVEGIATDISQNSLRDAPYMLSLFGYSQTPLLICCDAHHLPFLDNSFGLVFVYQALHHFNNPVPIAAECHRVLAKGGHFFFNDEPMDSTFRRFLRGSRVLSHPRTRLQQVGYRLGVEKLFWDDGAIERSLGMTEARFDIELWRDVLHPFRIVSVEVNRKLKLRSDLRKAGVKSFLSGFVGGNVRGLCQKVDGQNLTGSPRDRLMCLECGNRLELSDLKPLSCGVCGTTYPKADGVIRMFPKQLETELLG